MPFFSLIVWDRLKSTSPFKVASVIAYLFQTGPVPITVVVTVVLISGISRNGGASWQC